MAIPEIFDGDEQTERLAGYFEDMYEYLIEQGVPEDCLPSPWHVLRRVTKAIDHDLLREWLDNYVAVEAESPEEDEDDDGRENEQTPPPAPARRRAKPRPSYLRALDPPDPAEELPDEPGEAT